MTALTAFLEQALALPTVIFTVLLGIALLYWGFLLVSGLGAEGPTEGLLDGAGVEGGFALLGWLGFGKVPFSVLVTVWSLAAFAVSYALMRWAGPPLEPMLGVMVPVLVGVLALVTGASATHLVADRLAPVFSSAQAERRVDLVGRTCRIETGGVDLRFGQARLEEAGDWRIIQVRSSASGLKRGDEALIIAWDDALDAFRIEPLAPGDPSSTANPRNPRSGSIA